VKSCSLCRGPNSTMTGLCVACQVRHATEKAMRSHAAAQTLRGATPIRPDLYMDPATVPEAAE
jgi:hypothetical protein